MVRIILKIIVYISLHSSDTNINDYTTLVRIQNKLYPNNNMILVRIQDKLYPNNNMILVRIQDKTVS